MGAEHGELTNFGGVIPTKPRNDLGRCSVGALGAATERVGYVAWAEMV